MNFNLSFAKSILNFSKNAEYALKVKPGDTVVIETMDCFANQIQSNNDTLETLDWDKINPATGPIFVEGAFPGDALKVIIEDINIANKGVICTGKNLGVLGQSLDNLFSRVIPIENGMAVFDSRLSLPLNPMIGVIGVAPFHEDINCGTPGSHGGNMDNTMITKGASIYFPVYTEGALFALGDLHAVMGDGEIGISGLEIAGRVKVRFEVIKNFTLTNPLLEDSESISTISSAPTLDEAIKNSVSDMSVLVMKRTGLPLHETAMLLSLAGNVQVCQVVDPLKTARFVLSRSVLESYGAKLQ